MNNIKVEFDEFGLGDDVLEELQSVSIPVWFNSPFCLIGICLDGFRNGSPR
jgi:hypothetical protein